LWEVTKRERIGKGEEVKVLLQKIPNLRGLRIGGKAEHPAKGKGRKLRVSEG